MATSATGLPARTLLLGGTSLLGWQLLRARPGVRAACSAHVRLARCADWPRVELEDAASVGSLLERLRPELVVHAGGVCDVDRCELDPAWAEAINIGGTRHLLAALPPDCRLVYCSSDHVFSGAAPIYDEASRPDAVSVYGRSRVAAEALIRAARPDALILRCGLALGPSIDGRRGHLDWLRSRSRRGLPLSLVAEEWRRPVAGAALAERFWHLAGSALAGVQHLTGPELWRRPELAAALARHLELRLAFDVVSRSTLAYPHLGRIDLRTRAPALGLLRAWREDLARSNV